MFRIILNYFQVPVSTVIFPIFEIKMTEAVPYQTCPKCKGEGILYELFAEWYAPLDSKPVTCPVCKGKMVIPMYVIKE